MKGLISVIFLILFFSGVPLSIASVSIESDNNQKKIVTFYTNSTDRDCGLGCTDPSVLFIEVGSTVEWINTSNSSRSFSTGYHEEGEKGIGFTADGRLNGHIDPMGTFSFHFSKPGEYQYFINEHRLLKVLGTIHVMGDSYSTDDTSFNILKNIMEDEKSLIPITSLEINPKNSVITVGIDERKNPQVSLNDYRWMLYTKIGHKFFKLENYHDIDFNNDKNPINPPLKQLKIGISETEIICNKDLTIIFKTTNGYPACVKPESIPKLIERGWAKSENFHIQTSSTFDCAKTWDEMVTFSSNYTNNGLDNPQIRELDNYGKELGDVFFKNRCVSKIDQWWHNIEDPTGFNMRMNDPKIRQMWLEQEESWNYGLSLLD